MNPIEKLRRAVKGQTALEYLLIIVVAIIVVVAVYLWVTSTAQGTQASANEMITNLISEFPL